MSKDRAVLAYPGGTSIGWTAEDAVDPSPAEGVAAPRDQGSAL